MSEAAVNVARRPMVTPSATELDALVACVESRARRRAAWLDTLGGDALADTVAAERHWQDHSDDGRAHGDAVAAADRALAAHADGPFAALCAAFDLVPAERELLMSVMALRMDTRLISLVQRIQSRPWVTEPLVARLFDHGRYPLWNAGGTLAAWELVRTGDAAPAEPPPLVADPALGSWILGDGYLDEALRACVWPLAVPPALPNWPVHATARAVRECWQRRQPVRLLVEGAPGSGRATFAACVASVLERAPILVHDRPAQPDWPRLWLLVQRQAVVSGAFPVWRGPHEPWPRNVPPAMVQALCLDGGEGPQAEPRTADLRVILPHADADERESLLRDLVPESHAWSAGERARLVQRPGVVVGDLARLARQGITTLAGAETELRAACAGRLGDQAQRLETGFGWDDLVLPAPLAEGLRDFAFEAERRTAYWQRAPVRRLFPGGRALVALFAGPPGTGKTMAAQVIARDLGVDLFRIDLATMMSKYIGETAKNLRRIFTRAAQMHAVLLFDEADALFATRTEVKDAHDRYANTDTNYLLQMLESFGGIALLASNRKTNMDSAFLRRIRYVFDFPRPDAAARRALWRRLAPPLLGVDAGALASTLDRLGDELELSGAQIKNALVAAHFAARRRGGEPAIRDLLKGVERELAKEGRALSPRDQQRLARHD